MKTNKSFKETNFKLQHSNLLLLKRNFLVANFKLMKTKFFKMIMMVTFLISTMFHTLLNKIWEITMLLSSNPGKMDEEYNLFGGLNEKGENVVKPLSRHYT